jgi:hypothetical protein
MKYLGFLLLIICTTSCDYFEKKKVNAEDILDQELQTFNWNEVDEYPSFSTCDTSATKEERKFCFENTLSQHISTQIGEASFVVNEAIHDTVMMTFQISEAGVLQISNIQSNAIINAQIPELEAILRESINGLPEIFPAIKRGQQVKTEFKMPIVINTD